MEGLPASEVDLKIADDGGMGHACNERTEFSPKGKQDERQDENGGLFLLA